MPPPPRALPPPAPALAALLLATLLAAPATAATRADPASDAPEASTAVDALPDEAPDYAAALGRWRDVAELNRWIGARFRYDMPRAMRLSETQRAAGGQLPIHAPADFYRQPQGVCVDLSRFAFETLEQIAPMLRPRYLMIEFNPVAIAGNTLRRHWLVSFERDGQRYFFADSKRPGHIAGPYASTEAFLADYAQYRGRTIVAHRELASYRKQIKARVQREPRGDAP